MRNKELLRKLNTEAAAGEEAFLAMTKKHSAVKERPILFSAPMVRAILEGTKSQTRRIVKPQPPAYAGDIEESSDYPGEFFYWLGGSDHGATFLCPYGQPGDRLWVRESWLFVGTDMARLGRTHVNQDGVIEYQDGTRQTFTTHHANVERWMTRKQQWRPSIHMPRWASRILLEVTAVRVERLKSISQEDALEEGVTRQMLNDFGCAAGESEEDFNFHRARRTFQLLWESINGPGSWEANPWVWVVEFKRLSASNANSRQENAHG